MKIEKFSLEDLNPAEYNPRTITRGALEGLSKSMEKFGYLQPIVVNVRDGRNRVISGHQRLKVMLGERVEEAECIIVDFDDQTEKAANIALNSETISGDWNLEGLETILEELKFEFPEFEEINLDELDIQFEVEGLNALGEEKDKKDESDNQKGDLCECPKCGFKWEK